MNTCPLKLSIAVLFAGAAFGATRADVWQDCTAWYVGGADAVGAFKNGDMTDIRHAAIVDSPTHGGAIRGTNEGVSNRCETVYSAASGRTFENQRTIYLSQRETASGTYKVYGNGVTLPFAATNENYTLLMRVKLDEAQPHNKDWVYVADMGYNGGTPNYAFAVRYFPNLESFGLIYHGGVDKPIFASPTNNVCTTLRGKWLELSITLEKTTTTRSAMRVGVAAEGIERIYWSTNYPFKTQSVPIDGVMHLAGVKGYKTAGTETSAARGSYQMISYWERVLTDAEILEAFKLDANDKFYRADKTVENHPALLKFGDKAWGGDVFCGTADGDAAIVTDFQNLGKFPGKLAAGKSLSIPFTVPATVTNLRQVVRVCAAKGSASLKFAIDGTESDAIGVLAGGTASYVFDRPCFTEGAHTLTISRLDSGVEALQLSAIEISGSWRLGWKNGNASELGGDKGYGKIATYNVGHLMTNDWKEVRSTVKATAFSDLAFTIADTDADQRPYYFRAKPYEAPAAGFDYVVLANDVEVFRQTVLDKGSSRFPKVSLKFPPGSLKTGSNTIRIKTEKNEELYPSPSATWIRNDYYELEVDKKPNGLTMQVK